MLLISSFTMVMAVHSAKHGHRKALNIYLVLTLICAAVFLGVKYFEYSHKIHEGLLPGKFYFHKGDTACTSWVAWPRSAGCCAGRSGAISVLDTTHPWIWWDSTGTL